MRELVGFRDDSDFLPFDSKEVEMQIAAYNLDAAKRNKLTLKELEDEKILKSILALLPPECKKAKYKIKRQSPYLTMITLQRKVGKIVYEDTVYISLRSKISKIGEE